MNQTALHQEKAKLFAQDEVFLVSLGLPRRLVYSEGSWMTERRINGVVSSLETVAGVSPCTWLGAYGGNRDEDVPLGWKELSLPEEKPVYKTRHVPVPERTMTLLNGFLGQGLWPLLHSSAGQKPFFLQGGLEAYKEMNRLFAEELLRASKTEAPVIFVHDHQYAYLAKYIKEKNPKAILFLFWHVAWPSEAVFEALPEREGFIEAMTHYDLIGFHTPFFRDHFLKAAQIYAGGRVDEKEAVVFAHGNTCRASSLPISVVWPEEEKHDIVESRRVVRERYGIAEGIKIIGGVERTDTVKGVWEKLCAYERLLAENPALHGKVTYVQMSPLIRMKTKEALQLEKDFVKLVQDINEKYGFQRGPEDKWTPVVHDLRDNTRSEVVELMQAADVFVVASLCDGLNLTSKEYVSLRSDETGVLVLSKFAGASVELADALIVNPFNIGELSEGLKQALNMSEEEQKNRMMRLRQTVKKNDFFLWSSRILEQVARIRDIRKKSAAKPILG